MGLLIPATNNTPYLDLEEWGSPTNPSANTARLYCKDDGGLSKVYFRDSAGTEYEVGGGGTTYWSRTGTTVYPSNAGDNAEIDLGAVTTGDALLLENDGGSGSSVQELMIAFLGSGGSDWAKLGSYRYDVSGEGSYENAVVAEVGGTVSFINNTARTRVGSGAVSHRLSVYTGTSDVGSFYFADGLSGSDATAGGFSYDHSTDELRFTCAGLTALDLGSSQILHYGPVAGADALLFPSANTDVDIATSPEVVDSFNPTGDGTVMWLYTVRSNSGANVRGGTIIVAWDDSGGTVTGLAESATSPEIGDTSGVTFTADMSGGLVRLLASVTTDNWSVYAYRIAIGNGFVL